MKHLFTSPATNSIAKIATMLLILIAIIGLSSFINNNDKITICHVPPGNPDNCHEITISMNALQTHLNHGDRIFCDDQTEYFHDLSLVNHDGTRIITRY